jgi:hypothetical protein
MTKPRLTEHTPKRQQAPALPDCDPLLIATFHDQQLVLVEQHHLPSRCAGRCAGGITHLDVQDWWR